MSQSANGHVSWPNHLRDGSNVTPIRKWEHEIHCESHFHAKFAEIFDQECMGKKKCFIGRNLKINIRDKRFMSSYYMFQN